MSSSFALRYCAAHSCLLALVVLLTLFSVSLWKATEQTKLYLNKTRAPAPFSDSELLGLISSSSSSSDDKGNSNNNNQNGNTNGADITFPISSDETEGIIAATKAANTLFSPFQLTQIFGIPMLIVVTPNQKHFPDSTSSSDKKRGDSMVKFLGNLNVTVWFAAVEVCVSKFSNSRAIVRSAFGDPSMLQFFPKMTGLENKTANAFLWLMNPDDTTPTNALLRRQNQQKQQEQEDKEEDEEDNRNNFIIKDEDYTNLDVDNNALRSLMIEECLLPKGNTKPIPEVEDVEVIQIQSSLQRSRISVVYHWPLSILIASIIAILFVSFAATKTIIDCEVKATLVSLLRTNSATSQQMQDNVRSSIANNNRNNLINSWSDEVLLDVAARRISAKRSLLNLMNKWRSSSPHHHVDDHDENNDHHHQNRDLLQSDEQQQTPPPSLQPSSARKLVIYIFVILWFLTIAGVLPYLMLVAAMELVFAIKGTDEFYKQAASPYFGVISLLVVFIPFSIIHIMHALKVVDCFFMRDNHAEFSAFLKQESIWARFWFSPRGYWLSALIPSKSSGSLSSSLMKRRNQLLLSSRSPNLQSPTAVNSSINDGNGPRDSTYSRVTYSSQLSSSTYNNMYGSYSPATAITSTNTNITNYGSTNDETNNNYYQQQQQQQMPRAPPNSRLSNPEQQQQQRHPSSSIEEDDEDETSADDSDEDGSSGGLSCTDRIILILSDVIGVFVLPLLFILRAALHCPLKASEKHSRRFLSPVLVASFLTMCVVGAVLLVEQSFALVGACTLACAAFLLITFGLVLPLCSALFLGSLVILSGWFRSALVDPICDVDETEVDEVLFGVGAVLNGENNTSNNSNVQQNTTTTTTTAENQNARSAAAGRHQQQQDVLSASSVKHSRNFQFEHPHTIHAAYIAFRTELEEYASLLSASSLSSSPQPRSTLTSDDLMIQQQQHNHQEGQPDSNRMLTTTKKEAGTHNSNNNNSSSFIPSCIQPCVKLVRNLSHNKGSKRKLLILRWVILSVFVLIPFILTLIMFSQVHMDSCGWEHFLPRDRDTLRKDLLLDNRTRYLLPYASVFDFCLGGSVSTNNFFSEVSTTHFAVSNKLGYGNSLVNYFLWDVTRNNINDETYNAEDAIFLEILSGAYRYLNSVLLNSQKSAQLSIVVPDFDPFGSVLGGKHDDFIENIRTALFGSSGGAGATGAALPENPQCDPTTMTAKFLTGVIGGSSPQIIQIQSARWCGQFFWPILVGCVVLMLFFILSRNDFRIISVLRHKALRKKITRGKRQNNNNRAAPSVTFDEQGRVVHYNNYDENGNDDNGFYGNNNNNNDDDNHTRLSEEQSTMILPEDEMSDQQQRNDNNSDSSDGAFSSSDTNDDDDDTFNNGFQGIRGSVSSAGTGRGNNRQKGARGRKNNRNNNQDNINNNENDDDENNNNNNSASSSSDPDAAASQAFIARMKTTFLVCVCLCFNTGIITSVGMASAIIHGSFFTSGCSSKGPEFLSSSTATSDIFPRKTLSFAGEGDPLPRISVDIFRTAFFPGIALLFLLLEIADFWCYTMLPFQNRKVDVEKLLTMMEQYVRAKIDLDRGAMMNIGSSASVVSSPINHNNNAFNYQQYLQYSQQQSINSPTRPNNNNNNNNNNFFTHSGTITAMPSIYANNNHHLSRESIHSLVTSSASGNNQQHQQGTRDSSGRESTTQSAVMRNFFGNNNNQNNNNNFPGTNNNNNNATSGRALAAEACGSNTMGSLAWNMSFGFAICSIVFWILLASLFANNNNDNNSNNQQSPMVTQFWLAFGCASLWKILVVNVFVHPAQRHWSLNLSLFATTSKRKK